MTVEEGDGDEELVALGDGTISPLGNVVCSGREEVSTEMVGSVGVSDGATTPESLVAGLASVDSAAAVLATARDSVTVVKAVYRLVSVDSANSIMR